MQVINPTSEQHWLELRAQDITSTEVGALFGIDSATYIPTLFELWNRKQGRVVVDFEENERTKWGKRFEDSIANGVANDNNWTVRKMSEYIRDPELRIGASFDYSIEEIKDPISGAVIQREGCFEIKNVDSMQLKQKWIIEKDDEGNETIEAPLHIELQVQHQLLVSGRQFTYLAAMVGGNKVILIKRVPDLAVHAAIKQKAAEFWQSIADNIPPPPNYARDLSTISKLYGYAEVGKVLDYSGGDLTMDQLVRDYRQAQQDEKAAKERKEALKAEMLVTVGDAEKVIGNGWSISAGMIAGAHIEFDRQPYRNFKPSFKKNFV